MENPKDVLDKTIDHINWLLEMNTRVRLRNPKEGHDYYEMALNDVLRFINSKK